MNRPPTTWGERLYRLWDHVSIYLPVLLIGALALGSYWVVQNAPAPQTPTEAPVVGTDPDYLMTGFRVRTYDASGHLKSDIQGNQAQHFPQPSTLVVDFARMRSIGPTGQVTTAQADRVHTNNDQSEYILRGNAVVVRDAPSRSTKQPQPRVEFQGEYLRIQTQKDQVDSHLPVLLIRGNDRITANSLTYNDRTRVADMQGQVKAVLAPRKKQNPRGYLGL